MQDKAGSGLSLPLHDLRTGLPEVEQSHTHVTMKNTFANSHARPLLSLDPTVVLMTGLKTESASARHPKAPQSVARLGANEVQAV